MRVLFIEIQSVWGTWLDGTGTRGHLRPCKLLEWDVFRAARCMAVLERGSSAQSEWEKVAVQWNALMLQSKQDNRSPGWWPEREAAAERCEPLKKECVF